MGHQIVWWVLLVGVLVIALMVVYGWYMEQRNKGGRVDELEGRVDRRDELIKRKNAYIKTLEKSMLESASAERVAATLNSMFAD